MTTSDAPRCPQCCMTRDERNAYKDGCPMNVPSTGCPFHDVRTSDDKTSPAEGVVVPREPSSDTLFAMHHAFEAEPLEGMRAAYRAMLAAAPASSPASNAEAVAWARKDTFLEAMRTGHGHDVWPKTDGKEAFEVMPLYAAPQPVQASPAPVQPVSDAECDAACDAHDEHVDDYCDCASRKGMRAALENFLANRSKPKCS